MEDAAVKGRFLGLEARVLNLCDFFVGDLQDQSRVLERYDHEGVKLIFNRIFECLYTQRLTRHGLGGHLENGKTMAKRPDSTLRAATTR